MKTHNHITAYILRFFALAFFFLAYSAVVTLSAQTKTYNVAVLLKSTRDKNIRYLLKDLELGIKKKTKP